MNKKHTKEDIKIIRSTAIVSACTVLSRGLGFLREILMAVFFGTSLAKSAFDIAFLIPNLFRRLFGEGALSSAFIPVFTESIEKDGIETANSLAGKVMTMLGISLILIVLGGVLLISTLIRFMPMGERMTAVLPLLRIMLPYMFFICMVALSMSILNSFHHFTIPAITPVLLNIIWILTLIFICPVFGKSTENRIYGVAWGILVAGIIQLLVQIPALLYFKIKPHWSFDLHNDKIRRILLLMGPVAVGMGVFQINTLIDKLLALSVGEWAPATLTYSERLIYFPLGIFATALGTVLLPTFSKQAVRDKNNELRHTIGTATQNIMFIMIPAAMGLFVLAKPIVRLAFVWRGGEFDDHSMELTARALMFYTPGLVVFSLYKVFVPAFYAIKDTKTPVLIGIKVIGLNLLLNITFILTWPTGYKHAGLAFATVIASATNCIALVKILNKKIGSPGWYPVLRSSFKFFISALIMVKGVTITHIYLADLTASNGIHEKLGQLISITGSITIGIVIYCSISMILCRNLHLKYNADM